MARSFNRVTLVGFLGKDPEIHYSQSGAVRVNISLAVTDPPRNDQPGKTNWIDVVVWGTRAEPCAQYLKKGSCILVDGALQNEVWQGKDGHSRKRHSVRASVVVFLDNRPSGDMPSSDSGETSEGTPF